MRGGDTHAPFLTLPPDGVFVSSEGLYQTHTDTTLERIDFISPYCSPSSVVDRFPVIPITIGDLERD